MTNTSISNFAFKGANVRAFEDADGKPLFCAKDVAEALGYTNTNKAIGDHCKGITNRYPLETAGGIQQMTFIGEGDLYRLIASSKLPAAQEFESWIFDDVVPSIRKHGGYMAGQESMSPEEMALASMRWLQSKVAEQAKQLEAQAPKVAFSDALTVSKDCILVGHLSKLLHQNGVQIGQNRLYQWLRDHKYLSSRKGSDWNMPTQKYVEQGLFQIKIGTYSPTPERTFETRTPMVTGKGQQYFVNKFLGYKGIGKAA
ncbi:phage antirepressor KilAC domain-containing protein [Bifidobacterium psychraerophilum]|uniref:phage antirepressor KilAC domain-containing protein n=1 Tax=Bifidobacterium psychraerophilum TaxID=218140 RepID=UPI0023F163F1|nr:phage antirepressor KilAC domain-containing protein [Bifidobacterium psychraerophilum]MCI1660950.1 phage antirepressor KilAC domain-containing protein [Bifidobacterium psychraerophilum]MCI1805437.1 phage antirepressor KilAC domain-containing protein [Bifidobacterium psychraerophilum]MCI2177136.1 phage antirepressor KilAC domain-containing protein [Bifidobacterium psychraerophilum]MCI2182945.1 phage antirepressor KilAC domain-containing protein [Bifidobacterium psychraerophilum]